MDMEEPLEVAFREVPAKEYAAAEPAEKTTRAAVNFMID
jgi:hypothetical protein